MYTKFKQKSIFSKSHPVFRINKKKFKNKKAKKHAHFVFNPFKLIKNINFERVKKSKKFFLAYYLGILDKLRFPKGIYLKYFKSTSKTPFLTYTNRVLERLIFTHIFQMCVFFCLLVIFPPEKAKKVKFDQF